MRILILVNGAQEHRPFYGRVGAVLEEQGYEVHYALDSHFTDVMYPDDRLNGNRHYFSDYFRANRGRRQPPPEIAGDNLSVMMFPDLDRFTYGFGQPRRTPEWFATITANLGHFFVELFDRYHFDAVVYENVSNSFCYFCWAIAQKRNAQYIGFTSSRMPGRSDIVDTAWSRDSRLEQTYHDVLAGKIEVSSEVERWVTDYIENFDDKEPDYIKHPHPFEATVVGRYFGKRPAMRMLRAMRYRVTQPEDAAFCYQNGNPFISYPKQFLSEVVRSAKIPVLKRHFYETDIDLSVPYFAYPIQFHPESSTSVDSPAYIDEWANIEGIIQNMPAGYRLYVKDHRHAVGRQPMDFYARLQRLPNAILVSPWYDPKRLMRSAKAIVCSTSTFGFEALVLGTPVFVLGHPFYDFFPGCRRLVTFDGAHKEFLRHDELKVSPKHIRAFITAYYLVSEEGRLDILSMYDDPKAVRWAANIIHRRAQEHRRAHAS